MIEVEIDGKKIKAEQGKMIIQVADEAGIYIPRFCYHKKLSIAANCRMCLVEVEKSRKPLPACATPVAEGMKVLTKSDATKKFQKTVMEFLLINHPLDCPICDQGGECELQDLAMGYGKDVSRFTEGKRSVEDENLGPLIATDMTRCIQCSRCVRFGREIAGLEELGEIGRGENLRIGTEVLELREMNDVTSSLQHVIQSEVSGNVIDVCPVGALTSRPYRFIARSWELQQHPSIAPHDCLGSHIFIHTRSYEYSKHCEVMRVIPRECEEINETWISDRDRFSYAGLSSEDRVTKPLIKQNGQWREVDWSIALNFAADHLTEIVKQAGFEKIGALVSPNATLQEQYLSQKLLRSLGSNNIDHRLQQTDFSDDSQASAPVLGVNVSELSSRDNILLIGSNLHREQPMAGVRVRQSVLKGGKVSVINPVDFSFHFNLSDKLISDDIIAELAGVAKALNVNADCLSGVSVKKEQEHFAKQLEVGEKRSVILSALALNHPYASVIKALAYAIANKTGASFGYLTPGANSTGAWQVNCVPGSEGLNAQAMLTNKLNAFVLLGVEPELDCVDKTAAIEAMKHAFVISLTSFANDAMRDYADVILPIAPFSENEGTLVNIEGRAQHFKVATVPLEDSRPAWKVLRVLGNVLNINGFDYVSVNQIFEECSEKLEKSEVKPLELPKQLPTSKNAQHLAYWPLYRGDMLVRRSAPLQKMVVDGDLKIDVMA